MRKACLLLSFFMLSACASPAIHMSPAEVADLSDDQLCDFNKNYRSESKTKAEIARRGVNCDRHYRECLRQGNQPGTQAMNYCIDLSRQNERLRYDRPAYDGFGFGLYGFTDYDHYRTASGRTFR